MQLRQTLIWLSMVLPLAQVSADCMFKVINYTNHAITAKLGFYNESELTVLIKPNTTAIESIPSQYACDSSTDFGSGRAHIHFPHDPAGAGANYAPATNSLNLIGRIQGSSNGRVLTADDGTQTWLSATALAIDEVKFEVKISRTGQANSRVAGTN